jgi:hypothetical protein
MHAASSTINEGCQRGSILWDKGDLFKVGAIAFEALSETGMRCRHRSDESRAFQLPKIFGLSLRRTLPMKRALWRAPVTRADSSSSQGICVLYRRDPFLPFLGWVGLEPTTNALKGRYF